MWRSWAIIVVLLKAFENFIINFKWKRVWWFFLHEKEEAQSVDDKMPQLIRDLSLDGRLNGGKPTSQQQVCKQILSYSNVIGEYAKISWISYMLSLKNFKNIWNRSQHHWYGIIQDAIQLIQLKSFFISARSCIL